MAGQTDWGSIILAVGVIGGGLYAWKSGLFNSLLNPPLGASPLTPAPGGYCSDGGPVNPSTGLCSNGTAPTTIPIAQPAGGQQCMGQDALGQSCPCPAPTGSPYATGNLLPQQTPYGTGYGSSYGANPYQQQQPYGYGGMGGAGGYGGYQGTFGYGYGGAPGMPSSGYGGYPSMPGGYGTPYGTSPYGQPGYGSPYGTQSPYGSPTPLGYAQGGGCNCTNCGGTNTITSQGYGQQQSPYGQQTSPYGIGIGGTPMTPYPYSPYPYMPTGIPGSPYPSLGYPGYPPSPYPYPYPPIGGGIAVGIPGIAVGGRGGISTRRYGYAGKSSPDLNAFAGRAIAQDAWGLR